MFTFKLEWNTNFFPNDLWIIWSGSIFQSWKFSSNNLFIHELWRLLILAPLFKFFNSLSLWLLLIVKFLFLGCKLFQIKFFYVLFNWSVMDGCIVFTKARWIILDRANNLKTVIFPSSDKFLALHIFNTFSIFASTSWSSRHFQVVYCMNNEFSVF